MAPVMHLFGWRDDTGAGVEFNPISGAHRMVVGRDALGVVMGSKVNNWIIRSVKYGAVDSVDRLVTH